MCIKKILQITILFSFFLVSFIYTFAQTDSPNNTIDVLVYQKVKPLIKENTFIVAYVDVDKIDLDGFIVGVSPLANQFAKVFGQKLRDLSKSESSEADKSDSNILPADATATDPNSPPASEPKADPNSPPASDPKADPNSPPVAEPKADPNAPPASEPKTDTTTDTETIVLESVDAEAGVDEKAGIDPLDEKFWSSVDMGDLIRQVFGGMLGSLRASGIKEFYVLSNMEIVQQCPALIAVPGRVDLKPELKLQLESVGIYFLPDRIGNCAIFAVAASSMNRSSVVANESDVDSDTAQPENPFESNPTESTPATPPTPAATIPDANTPNVLVDVVGQKTESDMAKMQNVLNVFRRLKNKDREEIKSALHIQRNAPIRVVFAPSTGIKAMANMMAPLAANSIPNANDTIKEQINSSLQVLNKLKSVSIGIIPEAIRLNFAMEFMTEKEAQDAYVIVVKSFNAAKKNVVEEFKKSNESMPKEQITKVTKLMDNFMPQLRKHRILHSTTQRTVEGIVTSFAELAAEKVLLMQSQISEQMQKQFQEQIQDINQDNNSQ
jgi:hypothetical protein